MPNDHSLPSLRDLLLRSDFGRAHPHRVDELLARTVDTPTPARHSDDLPLPERVA